MLVLQVQTLLLPTVSPLYQLDGTLLTALHHYGYYCIECLGAKQSVTPLNILLLTHTDTRPIMECAIVRR